MPIYEYRCEHCGHQLEKLQKASDGPLRKCPQCGESKLRRLISAVGFRLKGSGWYETDFKSKNKHNLAASETDKKPTEKADGKSDGESKKSMQSSDKKTGAGGAPKATSTVTASE